MIQPSIFRELNIICLIKESTPSCRDEEACSRVRHALSAINHSTKK